MFYITIFHNTSLIILQTTLIFHVLIKYNVLMANVGYVCK